MRKRRDNAQLPSIADKNIQFLPALENRAAQAIQRIKIAQVTRHEGCFIAQFANVVVEFFQRALCSGQRNHMRALTC